MSAIFSECGRFRWLLERNVEYPPMFQPKTVRTIGWIGVNPSIAGAEVNDQSVRKMLGFSERLSMTSMLLGNLYGRIATDVKRLALVDNTGSCEEPMNALYITRLIEACDVVVPCWGSRTKLPKRLHGAIDHMRGILAASGKPCVWVLGLTKSGDPKHPLMVGWNTPFKEWAI